MMDTDKHSATRFTHISSYNMSREDMDEQNNCICCSHIKTD